MLLADSLASARLFFFALLIIVIMLKYCFDEQNVLKLLRVKTLEPAPITDSFADSPDANLVWKVVIKLTLGNFYLCFIYQPFSKGLIYHLCQDKLFYHYLSARFKYSWKDCELVNKRLHRCVGPLCLNISLVANKFCHLLAPVTVHSAGLVTFCCLKRI